MITNVFETYSFTEVLKVKKTVQETQVEAYYDTVSRNERVYEPPTGVTFCLHCGDKLRDSMWTFSKSGKYLCPSCWYNRTTASQREEYRRQAQRMSSGGYSYKTITERVQKTRSIIKEKEIEVEEPITKYGTRLLLPIDIEYKEDNKLIKHVVPFSFSMSNTEMIVKPKYFHDDIIRKEQDWFHTLSYTNAISKLSEIKHGKDVERVKIFSLGPIPYNEIIVDEKQVLEEFVDVVGFYPNVPAFIQGHPLNMYNNKRKNIVNIDKVITIYCNLAIDSKADYGHYKNRGVILYSLIDHLINDDIKVNLKLLDATFIDGESVIQEFEPQVYKKLDLKDPDIYKLKDEQDQQLSFLYNILTSISFYRVIMLENKANIINSTKLNNKWFDGFGYCIKNKDLRKILNINDDTILIGNPFEHGISGLFMDDDFANLMESIGLYQEAESITYESDQVKGHIFTLEEIIKQREITKLIHVTASDNIPSIMELGIVPKKTLEQNGRSFHQNDYQRLDKHTDAICLSVSEPNNFLFKEYSKRNPKIKYQIIEIDPKILYDSKNDISKVRKIFSDYNAASRYSKSSEVDFEILFQDRIRRKAKIHTRDGLESYHPTSAQAEILFFGAIPKEYILNIYDYHINEKTESEKKQLTKTISEICREIGTINAGEMHKTLLEVGYLEIKRIQGKEVYVPTEKGKQVGISLQARKSAKEEYFVNIYNKNAEKIVKEIANKGAPK